MLPHSSKLVMLTLIVWVGAVLSGACNRAGQPRQIAAAPRLTPIAEYPGNDLIIYQALIELQVGDVDAAAVWAEELTQRYGGYRASMQTWDIDGRASAALELIVPTSNYDRLRDALVQIGVLINETSSGRQVNLPPGHTPYSSITLRLRPAEVRWSPPATQRWDPGRTFQRALDVFLLIFGFLADIIIWVVVVAGPFAATFYIARKLIRRLRS